MRKRLDQLGKLITVKVGKFNELSDGGHFLLDAMAASWVAYEERSSGIHMRDKEGKNGKVQGELRRQFSTVNSKLVCSAGCTRWGRGGGCRLRPMSGRSGRRRV